MSIWVNAKVKKPPLDEDVLILFKDKRDELKEENLFYGIAHLFVDHNFKFERWSYYTAYQGYYEVVFWTPLPDMPRLENRDGEQYE